MSDTTCAWVASEAEKRGSKFIAFVPAWDSKNTALLWVRGSCVSAQSYNETIVGIIKTTP